MTDELSDPTTQSSSISKLLGLHNAGEDEAEFRLPVFEAMQLPKSVIFIHEFFHKNPNLFISNHRKFNFVPLQVDQVKNTILMVKPISSKTPS
jgi:hypothetical protein